MYIQKESLTITIGHDNLEPFHLIQRSQQGTRKHWFVFTLSNRILKLPNNLLCIFSSPSCPLSLFSILSPLLITIFPSLRSSTPHWAPTTSNPSCVHMTTSLCVFLPADKIQQLKQPLSSSTNKQTQI